MLRRSFPALLFCALFVPSVQAQTKPEDLQRLIEIGRDHSMAKATHTELCEKIGARLTGSLAMERATKWAVDKFKRYGVPNVYTEEWGRVPTGFDRGARQSVKMVSPYSAPFVFTTPCWTPGTRGPVRGKVIKMPMSAEEVGPLKRDLKGAWVLMPTPAGMRSADYRKPTELDRLIDDCGIAGRIYHTDGDIVWTHGTWKDYSDESRPKTPLIVIRKPDFNRLEWNMRRSKTVEVEADIENIFTRREMPCSNIIAEIPGTEKPNEVVIIGGHYDSWNGPGSQGASDNGTGSMATMEAARILIASGVKPKRTIRIILWTGEEQGLLGSTGYVEKHKDELENVVAMFNEDTGQNWEAAVPGLPEMMPMLREAAAPLANAFPGMPFEAREVERLSRSGSDHVPFVNRGVPALFLIKGGDLSYGKVWHTQNDRAEEVPDMNLRQMATNMAVLAYTFASIEGRLPRVSAALTTTGGGSLGGYFGSEDHDDDCGTIEELMFKLTRKGFR
jgi:hypothetical protein